MLFNSYVFLLGFLPVSIVGYYLLGRLAGPAPAKTWLAALSLVFYGWWNPAFVLLLATSVLVNYSVSTLILRAEDKPERQRAFLTLGVVLNLLPLAFFKYLFVAVMFFHHAGLLSGDFGRIILPLGISFFTFTQIGYLVDCQQGIVKTARLIDYWLFVTFFPHLIAGPILHHREIMPQFADPETYRFRFSKIAVGLTVFIFGLFKKVILADSIAPWADAGYAHAGTVGQLAAVTAIFAYSLQLYFDFSGYSDMAVGLAAMFGVSFPLNFNSPYKARSVIDYWSRWHMTLTRYLTLLIYNPISLWIRRMRMEKGQGVNRSALATVEGFGWMIALPTFVTMFVSGIWHGAGFQFLIWGLLHAGFMIINHAWANFRRKPSGPLIGLAATWDGIWKVALTYLAVVAALVFFRAPSLNDALSMFSASAGAHGAEFPLALRHGSLAHGSLMLSVLSKLHLVVEGPIYAYTDFTVPLIKNTGLIIGLTFVVWAMPNTNEMMGELSPALTKPEPMRWRWMVWRPNLVWALITVVALSWAFSQMGHPSRFLYFQF